MSYKELIETYLDEHHDELFELVKSMFWSACRTRLEIVFDKMNKEIKEMYIFRGDGYYQSKDYEYISIYHLPEGGYDFSYLLHELDLTDPEELDIDGLVYDEIEMIYAGLALLYLDDNDEK